MYPSLSKSILAALACLFLIHPLNAFAHLPCRDIFKSETLNRPLNVSVSKSIAQAMIDLIKSGRLLNQTSKILKMYPQHKFLIEDGGLCSSTCGVNGTLAVLEHLAIDDIWAGTKSSRFSDSSLHNLMTTMIQQANSLGVPDPRKGLSFENLQKILTYVFKYKQIDDVVSVKLPPAPEGPSGTLREADLQFDENELLYLTVTTSNSSSHAIVVLEVDNNLKTIKYLDPNLPNKILETSYAIREIDQEHSGIYMNWAPEISYRAKGGWIVNRMLVRTESLTQYPYLRFKSWEGISQVEIKLKDGSVLQDLKIKKVEWKVENPYLEYRDYSKGWDNSQKLKIPLSQITSITKVPNSIEQ